MTALHVAISPAIAAIRIRPFLRNADGHVVGLPAETDYPLVAGVATITLAPSTTQWCYESIELGLEGATRYWSLPDSLTTQEYDELVDVDPYTFEPSVEAVTGWTAVSAAVQVDADAAAASAAASAASAAVSAALVGTAVPLASLVRLDPALRADGPITTFDTAHSASPASFGVAPLSYVGGKIAHTPALAANSAGYLQVDAGSRVRRFGAMVAWQPASIGAAAFVLPVVPWGTPGSIVSQSAGIHLVMYGNGIWSCGRWNWPSGTLTIYADNTTHGRYADVRDGVARPVDVWMDIDASTMRIYFPDGTSAAISSSYIAADTANTVVWELYENNGVTDTPATFGKLWVDTNSIDLNSAPAVTRPGVSALVEAGQRAVTEQSGAGTISGTVPSGCKGVLVTCIAPGSGGGSGRRGAAGTVRGGGSAGGSGGIIQDVFIPVSALGSTWSLVVGAVGTGGAAVTVDDTSGNAGTGAGTAQFTSGSALLRALGGGGGGGGAVGAGSAGNAGAPLGNLGVAGSAAGAVGTAGGSNFLGGCGSSGAGGGITTANAASNGGAGSASGLWSAGAGGAGGVVDTTLPGQGAALLNTRPGDGAGGGASSVTTAAQAGATALGHGAGGGGGGASLNGNNSGAGGNGGPGYGRVTVVKS